MITGAATRRIQFLPHRFVDNGLELAIKSSVLDGQRSSGAAPDPERHLLDLSAQRFSEVTMRVEVGLAADLLAEVVPEAERHRPPVRIALGLRCAATHVRRSFATAGDVASGRVAATVSLTHAEIAGAIELGATLIRTTNGVASDGYARDAGARLASARPWEVRLDPGTTPRGQFLDIRYIDFRDADRAQFPQVDALYQLVTDGEAPILWMNSAHARVCAALDSTGTSGRVARLRDVSFERIFHAVWLRLFLQSTRDLARSGDVVLPWQDAVLKKWLPALYPETGGHDSRIERLRRELDDGDELEIVGRLDGLLQADRQTPRLYDALVEEIEK